MAGSIFYITLLIMLNIASTSNEVIISSVALIPDRELLEHSPETTTKHIQSCSVKLFNAKNQNYDTEQKITYNTFGKVKQIEDYSSQPKETIESYNYNINKLCTSFVYMIGEKVIRKGEYTYNSNNTIKYIQLKNYSPQENEPSLIIEEYDYDSSQLLKEKRTVTKTHKITSKTQYIFKSNTHITTKYYGLNKQLVFEENFTCDSALLFPKYFPQKKGRICKKTEWNDSTHVISTKYYSKAKKSNYTTEEVIHNMDSTILSVTILSRKKKYILAHKYNENKKVVESTITQNSKLESKKKLYL